MKRQIRLSLLLTLSVMLSLASSPSTAQGQQPQRLRADSGVVTLGAGQVLRATVAGAGNDTVRVRFRWTRYALAGCGSDGVCRQAVSSQGATQPASPGPADALHYDQGGPTPGVRVVVESSSRDVRVVFQIIATSTGDIIAIWVPQGSPFVGNQ